MAGVHVKAVSKAFNGQPVLQGVDLAVPDRSVLALLGPSGCGKTTLLRLIAGFERADTGEILLGSDVVERAGARAVPPERRRIGYVPQDGSLFPHLTAAGNVAYGLPRHERDGPRVRASLDLVDLAQFGGFYPHQLSGGQQQRVALARALAPQPALMLLDEPFNALDLDLRRSMCEEVVALLRRSGATVILVTHDPGEAFSTADLVAVMQDGRIMQCAPPDVVYGIPASPVVARLTGPAVFLQGIGRGPTVETALGSVPVRQPCGEDTQVSLMLRPEQFVLTDRANGREATVTAHRFRGSSTMLSVVGRGFQLDINVAAYRGEKTVFLAVTGSGVAFPASV
jgi:iron(III) transport system ATP-binding protein